jgi:hypothetical protein
VGAPTSLSVDDQAVETSVQFGWRRYASKSRKGDIMLADRRKLWCWLKAEVELAKERLIVLANRELLAARSCRIARHFVAPTIFVASRAALAGPQCLFTLLVSVQKGGFQLTAIGIFVVSC